jgi:hypothetical protein
VKPQFSLATLLICVTVLAIVAGMSTVIPVTHVVNVSYEAGPVAPTLLPDKVYEHYRPEARDIAWRLALWWPISIAGTLAVRWIVRRLRGQPTKLRAV